MALERFESLLFFLLSVSVVLAILLRLQFYRILMLKHRDEWEELGKPWLDFNHTPAVAWVMSRYIWGGKYRRVQDAGLNRAASAVKLAELASAVFFFLVFLAW